MSIKAFNQPDGSPCISMFSATVRYHIVDRNTLLTRWIVNVSTMNANAHIYVLTKFNYVQRDIIRYIWSRMLTNARNKANQSMFYKCGATVPLCVALLHFDELIK